MKKFLAWLFCVMLLTQPVFAQSEKKLILDTNTQQTENVDISISAPSALLMEKTTGNVLYEKEADVQRAPASVTKIMTLLLIFDALEDGKITLEDEVTVSERAASMGGSQVFLEVGEKQTVDTMLKCIAVASANDACVAMAEHISGSEEAFVKAMNERAKGLGMEHTSFVNCNGLDAEGHMTTARDIAKMSRELIVKYPKIREYSMIWMDHIVHMTRKGSSDFGLSNTNKMVRMYEHTTGLKTGSTGNAKFCVSATAEKNGMEMIAVVLGAETSKERFADAVALLNYGFGRCSLYRDEDPPALEALKMTGGKKEWIPLRYEGTFSYLDTEGKNLKEIEVSQELPSHLEAPVKEGEEVGRLVYRLGRDELGSVKILAGKTIEKTGFLDMAGRMADGLLL